MPLLRNISTLYICPDTPEQQDVQPIKDGVIAWSGSIIEWAGPESDLPDQYKKYEVFDAGGKMVIPGLIDCHTHLAFGGWRSDEFEMRLQGKSYLDIAKSGGGILSTVRATRDTSEEQLYEKAAGILKKMLKLGVTTVECKSGYGLTTADELKTLNVYKKLSMESHQHIVSTFLGAHTFPEEFKGDKKVYIDLIINEMIPAVTKAKLADFCDIFVEDSAFTVDEAREILLAASRSGLKLKLHADQLSSGGGAELASELNAVSADHLEQISENGIRAMAKAGVIGVSLPIASLYTRQPYLNCRKLVDGGVQVAVATDFNPGSAPSYDLPLAMMLSCNHGHLTPSEVLKGATINAAKAIHMNHWVGSIEPGKCADFLVVDAPDVNFWMYHFRSDACEQVFLKGLPMLT
jgi:imidazolonepropionase